MFIIAQLFIAWVVSAALMRIFAPRVKGPTAAGLGDFQVPTAEERPIPIVVGTCHVKGVNTLWYGDLKVEAIKRGGGLFSARQTIGHKYSLGMQLGICQGPIELLEVRIDDRPIPSNTVLISSGNDGISFENVFGPPTIANIPHGVYTSYAALGLAASTAMIAAYGPSTWRVVYGYDSIPNFSDELVYAVKVTGGSSTNMHVFLPAASGISGALRASQVAIAMNAVEATRGGGPYVQFSCDFDPVSQKFTIGAIVIGGPPLDGWYLRGVVTYTRSHLASIGYQMGADRFMTGFPSSTTSDYPTGEKRFTFAFAGLGGKMMLTDPLFTSASTFGYIPGIDRTIRGAMADQDRSLAGSAIYDQGDYYDVVINQPKLFGGEESEGGVVGTIRVYKGTETQVADPYLQAVIGKNLPAYKGLAYAVLLQLYIGTSPYLKGISFVVRCIPDRLGMGSEAVINGDANPVNVVYEWLTNPRWNFYALDPAKIDLTNFTNKAAALFDEDFGVSINQDQARPVSDVIGEVMRHLDGVLYVDPDSGKLSIQLARNDYTVGTLPIVNRDNGWEIKTVRPSWINLVNDVRVKFTDRDSNFQERTAMDQDLATIQARGGKIVTEEFDFRGISRADVAQRQASRVLNTVDYAFARSSFKVDREMWKLRPGGVFKLVDPDLGTLIMRVLRVQEGDEEDSRLTIESAEDIFSIDWVGFGASDPSEWEDPSQNPVQLLEERLEEAPYVIAGNTVARKIMTMGGRSGVTETLGYKVYSDPIGGSAYTETQDVTELTPVGALLTSLGPTDTEITVENLADVDLILSTDLTGFEDGVNMALIGDEWIAFQNITLNDDGSYTLSPVARGVMDSVPALHSSGAGVLFFTGGFGFVQTSAYGSDLLVAAKLRPYNSVDTLSLETAARHEVQLSQRTARPYPPTGFLLNGEAYPDNIFGELTISWTHRNRLGTWDFDDSGATGALETATHYRIRIYGDGGTLKHTQDNITGTSYLYPAATETSENGGNPNATLRIVLESIQDGPGLICRQAIDWSLLRNGGVGGWGDNFGGDFGS